MTRAPIRWGVIGTGGIARRFAGDLAYSTSGVLAAVGSRDGTRAFAFTADFGDGIVADETDRILARPDVDAIYVGTVNRAHAGIAIAALEAGKPVLVEKPLAPTSVEAAEIRDVARRRGLLAMEAMWMVFTPGIVRLRALLAAGAIGEARSLSANLSYARAYRPDQDIFDPRTGGALLDLGVYPIALAHHLFGAADEVAAVVERNEAGSLRQAALVSRHGKVLAKLSCGFETEGPNGAMVSGEHGRIALAGPFFCPPALTLTRHHAGTALDPRGGDMPADAASGAAVGHGNEGAPSETDAALEAWAQRRPETIATPVAGSGLQYQADHFADCLAKGLTESPLHPLSASLAAIAVIERATTLRPSKRAGRRGGQLPG
ncbi:Gfo/Idh/MocA family oxidoreductase [Jiella sonneratiae]|uniref:Gfo/Idh/MocA family oxidoreductase n=1 Tax=Jiella sonneratiae TaxID=2816856 RepID=A0ABS3J8L5_9HYPH|nr:Gfo/Idh/MocA family oxidoreductase [Jiella sonneratiae]MBO0906009.1 Gfo/Idh/MocA family oxidoreductase [Jiella sonneratiae]